MDILGWFVKRKSVQKELFFCIWVGWFISCWNPSEEVYANNLVPSENHKYGLQTFLLIIR